MPTVDIPDKVCPHCGGTKWRIEKENRKYWVRTRYRCVEQLSDKYKNWALRNPEKVKDYQKGRKIDYQTPKYRDYSRKKAAKHSTELTDKYIRYVLRHNPIYRNAIITPEMIQRKREHLKLERQLKNLENVQTQQTKQAETHRGSSLPNGRESKKGIRQV